MAQGALPHRSGSEAALRLGEVLGPASRYALPATLVLLALFAFGHLAFWPAFVAWLAAVGFSLSLAWLRQRELTAASAYINAVIDGRDPGPPPGSRVFASGALESALRRLNRWLTELHQKRVAADRMRQALLDALPDPVLLVDAGGTIRRANGAAAELLGPDLAGRPLPLALRDPGLLGAVEGALAEGHGAQLNLDLAAPARRAFGVHVLPVDLPGEGPHAVVALRERTEELMIERMRSDFVANVSHELRTPLTALSGFIETLRGPARDDAEARERFLAIMAGEAERMGRLIHDLLSLSRIELVEHQPPKDRVDPAACLRHVVGALAPQAERRGVMLELEIPDDLPPVCGDRDQLVQLFTNLIENAIKYGGGPDGPVRIEAHAIEAAAPGAGVLTGRPALRVAVTDRGPGIAREHIPRLTERFFRVDAARSRGMGGTGLGLAIVKHILRRHRGHLAIASELGKGSTFTVYLPLRS
jgi:two-component system, OmpR family, phosphate regulon sensor histidine kinase PhoR